MGRRKKKAPTFVVGESQEFPASVEQGFEPAYVQIGGVRITNHGLSWPQQASAGDVSRKHQRQQQHPPWRSRRSRQQRRSSPNSSSDEGHDDDDGKVGCSSDRLDEALQDYLDNVLRGAGGSGSSEDCGGDGAKRGSGRGGSGRRSGAATHRGLQGRRDGARLPAVSRDKEESSEAELRVPVRGRGICVRLSDNEEEEDDQRSMPDDDDEDEEEEEEECEREGVDGGFGEGGGGDEELEDLRESEEEEVYGDAAMLHRLLYGFAGRDLGESEGEEESGGRGNLYEALLASKLHSDTDDSEEDKAVEKHCTEDEDEGLSYSQWIGLGHHRRRRQAHQPHRGAGGRGKEPVRSGTVNYYYEYQYDSEGKEKVVVVEASPEAVAVPSKLLVSQRAAGSSREDQTRQRNQKVSKDSISIASTKQLRCGAADCGSTGDVGAGDRHGRGVRAEAAGGIDVRSDRHDSGPGNPQRVGIGGEAVAAVAAVEAAAVAGAGESEEEAGIARTPVLEAHVSRFPFVMRSREQVRAAAAATAATLMAISATGGATPAAPRSGRNRQQEQYQPYQLQQPRQRSVVRGALNGALRPGEKKKLKKEKMQAKRAAREAVRGFDVERVAEQIADFVSSEGDMLALEPLGSYGTAVAQSLAGVYGLKHSIQGARKHKFLLLQPTDRTKAPDEATRDKVDKIVTAEISRQRRGAAEPRERPRKAAADVGPAPLALLVRVGRPKAWREESATPVATASRWPSCAAVSSEMGAVAAVAVAAVAVAAVAVAAVAAARVIVIAPARGSKARMKPLLLRRLQGGHGKMRRRRGRHTWALAP
ncbi:hypothetical protein Vretifemale_798 [Volvox reticuliferus]|uniref:R3H domain-containing protein n=1 Tax=Volvox reticuliferus TaxID=1737510 RepID=A0A8J4C277_9CHLO|nr:hypothetical protein Vretifemale_798 [Volvox reticuliferus]